MLVLALDTTVQTAAVALCQDEKVVSSFSICAGNRHSEILLPMIEQMLKLSGYKLDDVELFACSSGPGSFTGVRIGVATIKGLAFGKDIPCVGVSSLEALAESLVDRPGVICPMIDARREQVYNALFESNGQAIKRLTEDRVLPCSELDEELSSLQKPVYLIGENMPDCLSRFSKCKPEHVHRAHCHADAAAVARVALRTLSDGKKHTDISLCPSYLRMPQAERERLEKLKAVAEAAQSQK